MKKKYFLGFFLILYLMTFPNVYAHNRELYSLDLYDHANLHYKTDRIFFCTQPQSGMHWTQYILRHFSKRPFSYCNEYYDLSKQEIDYSLPFIHHSHSSIFFEKCSYAFSPPDMNEDKILIILRNPLDSLLRGLNSFEEALTIAKAPPNNWRRYWLINLNYLDQWPEKNRHVFYYEDLLDNPRAEIQNLLNFTSVSDEGLNEFIDNINIHKQISLNKYQSDYQTLTDGVDRNFHQRPFTENELSQLLDVLRQQDPYIWNKYLKRYDQK